MTDETPSPSGRHVSALQREAEARQTDRELAALVLQGDEVAFRQLYRRHTPRLMALVMRFVGGNEADAEDVVQEAWVRAAQGLERFRWEAAFGSWVSSIALNLARELIRRHGRRQEVEWPGGAAEPPAAEPLAMVETSDLERAIAALPAGYRSVLVLHDVEGYRHDEIAGLLGVSVGTSKSQLFHARRAMRAQLGGRTGKDQDDV